MAQAMHNERGGGFAENLNRILRIRGFRYDSSDEKRLDARKFVGGR